MILKMMLYFSKDKPIPCKGKEIGNGIYIRIDPETNKEVGFTIIDYMKRINNNLLKSVPGFEDIELPKYKMKE